MNTNENSEFYAYFGLIYAALSLKVREVFNNAFNNDLSINSK